MITLARRTQPASRRTSPCPRGSRGASTAPSGRLRARCSRCVAGGSWRGGWHGGTLKRFHRSTAALLGLGGRALPGAFLRLRISARPCPWIESEEPFRTTGSNRTSTRRTMRFDKLTTKFQAGTERRPEPRARQRRRLHRAAAPPAALLAQEDGGTASLLARAGVPVPRLQAALKQSIDRLPKVEGTGGEIGLSRDLNNLLNLTDKEAASAATSSSRSEIVPARAHRRQGRDRPHAQGRRPAEEALRGRDRARARRRRRRLAGGRGPARGARRSTRST